jgi:hypothetical protein
MQHDAGGAQAMQSTSSRLSSTVSPETSPDTFRVVKITGAWVTDRPQLKWVATVSHPPKSAASTALIPKLVRVRPSFTYCHASQIMMARGAAGTEIAGTIVCRSCTHVDAVHLDSLSCRVNRPKYEVTPEDVRVLLEHATCMGLQQLDATVIRQLPTCCIHNETNGTVGHMSLTKTNLQVPVTRW